MKVIATEKAPGAIGPYSQGFLTNGFVYTSGQIPVNPADGTIPEASPHRRSRAARTSAPFWKPAAAALTRWSRPPASWPTSRILRPSTRFTPSSSPPSPPAAVSPSRTCPRASCARSRPSQRRDPPSVPGSGCCMKLQKKPELRCRLADQFWLLLFYDRAGRAALTCGASVTSKTCAQHGRRCRPGCRTPGTRPRPARRPAGRRT